MDEFKAELKKLSSTCAFGGHLDDALCETSLSTHREEANICYSNRHCTYCRASGVTGKVHERGKRAVSTYNTESLITP